MWLPGSSAADWLRERGGADRGRSRSRVLVFARAVSERSVEGGHGARRLVARAGRGCRGDVPARRWSGSMRQAFCSTKSRTSPGDGFASRHNLKYWTDGEWLGFGCGAHSTRRWRAVEECLVHGGLHRAGTAGRDPWCGAARAHRGRATRGRAVHRPAAAAGHRHRCRRRDVTSVTCGSDTARRFGPFSRKDGWFMRGPDCV